MIKAEEGHPITPVQKAKELVVTAVNKISFEQTTETDREFAALVEAIARQQHRVYKLMRVKDE